MTHGLDIKQRGQRAGLLERAKVTFFLLAMAAAFAVALVGSCIVDTGEPRFALAKLCYGFAMVYMMFAAMLPWVNVSFRASMLRSILFTATGLHSLAVPIAVTGKGGLGINSSSSDFWPIMMVASPLTLWFCTMLTQTKNRPIESPADSDATDSIAAVTTADFGAMDTDWRATFLLNLTFCVTFCVILMLSGCQEPRFWFLTVPVTLVVLTVPLFTPTPVPPACTTVALILNFMQLMVPYFHIFIPQLKAVIFWALGYQITCGLLIFNDLDELSNQRENISLPQVTRRTRTVVCHIAILVMWVGFLVIVRESRIAECMALSLIISEAVLILVISQLHKNKSRAVPLIQALEMVNIFVAIATTFSASGLIYSAIGPHISGVFHIIVNVSTVFPLWAVLFYSKWVFVPSFKDGTVDQPVVLPKT